MLDPQEGRSSAAPLQEDPGGRPLRPMKEQWRVARKEPGFPARTGTQNQRKTPSAAGRRPVQKCGRAQHAAPLQRTGLKTRHCKSPEEAEAGERKLRPFCTNHRTDGPRRILGGLRVGHLRCTWKLIATTGVLLYGSREFENAELATELDRACPSGTDKTQG
jgi:hypothetical protein